MYLVEMQRNSIQLVCRALSTTLVAALIASGPNVVSRSASTKAPDVVRDAAPTIDFNRQVRPILSDKCFRCHGPDTAQRQAGLRLDRPESALKELESGVTAIVPGEPSRSEMIRRIFSDDPEERMPPPDSQKSLTDVEKALLRAWVADGANYSKHWSFVRPNRPAPPILSDDKWSTNDIDHFIFQRLRHEKLTPSAETDRRTLIRRVSFDLNGLPPTISEVDAFLADNQPGAYERVVDQLLASSRFGERMAMHWLDLARYADTDGYEKDGHRQMWPYRDWVIRAFNNNKPFDEFTIEQLAGDMLSSPSRDQLIATAFNRNNPTTSEAGSDPDEFAAKYAIDRLNTTASVWLGLTTQCAECHDHKFDPITTEDFYRLFAFFNQMPEVPLYEGPDAPPSIMVATPEQEKKLSELNSQIAAAKAALEKDPKGATSAAQRDDVASLEKQAADFRAQIPKVRVMQPAGQARATHILIRGDYLNPGKEVTAGIPAVFGELPNARSNRLALARWIVSDENPLTARVVVNRLWAMCFGTGLVSTMNDFGTQGELPSHPELLDWLATEFVARHWDLKATLRLIVTSSTYRQSSHVTPGLLERDPRNRLLTRGPRYRLPAEMIRDNALAVSGLLHEQLGGPSNFSYHPAGLWEEMAWADSPWKTWPQQHDTNLYRRGLYTFWKRSVLHPVMSLFDAPSRNVCEVARSTTNTPLQAYVTLNETSFVEAARFLAVRMMGNGGDSPENAIEQGYLRATLRPPSDNERRILRNLYDQMQRHFNEHPAEAEALLAVGESSAPKDLDHVEVAAWTTIAQVILNLDETITKE
jgi:mono/diheme cytochrome c family protein